MPVRLFLLLTVFTTSLAIQAQMRLPATVQLKDDTLRGYTLGDSNMLYFEDLSGKQTFEEIRQKLNGGQMKQWDGKKQTAKGLEHPHWLYYKILNRSTSQQEAGVLSRADYADLFVIRTSGKVDSFKTGEKIPWSRKKEFKINNVIAFALLPNDSVEIFQRMEYLPASRTAFAIAVVKPEKYARKRLADLESASVPKDMIARAFFSAFVIFMGLIYLVFYRLVNEKVFLYFGLFLLTLAANVTDIMYSVMREYPILEGKMNIVSQASFFFFIHFYREYLHTRIHAPKWDKVLRLFSYVYMIVLLSNTFLFPEERIPLIVVIAILPALLIATHFIIPGKMLREKKFLAYTTLPLLILLILLLAIFFSGVNISDDFINPVFLLAFFWMIMAFSSTLVQRFIEQRKSIIRHEQDKEIIEKERELERLKLAELQKITLEKEVEERTSELKQSLENLKAAQGQLIQAEKMASLGEMTAGIAHEIQNPLNFVNNFAEVNYEITEEIRAEMEKLVPEDQRGNLNDLLNDLSSNQEKIRFHGKRADTIVKNMLMHSRKGTLHKEPVQLNALVDEYTKLSFHGLRARDKSFNADFEVQADPSIETVDLLLQDFGRVLLNLVNNAFYAVHEKAKSSASDYKPKVTVKTSRDKGYIRIEVIDNGNGISEHIRDKIFQPFFTTKPTGEGTGLGLSLSYDIITKGHGGKISVDSKEGEGTRFIIELPN